MSYHKQLKKMVKQVCEDIDEKELWSIYSKEGYKEITKRINPPDLMEAAYLRYLPACHTVKDKKLYLEEPFSSGKHVRLLKAKGEEALVVKWYQSSQRNTSYEIEVYLKLKSLGCPLPYFSCAYEFWGHPVLVMERLEKLGKSEDVYKLGRQVLEQLQYLHSFAIHCDIKPDNIMKRVTKDKSFYFLIDYGGVAQDPLDYGYRRWIWSKYWTSQEPHKKKQIATARHDFKELGYTMNYLKYRGEINYRKDFKGRLKTYMDRVKKIDKTKIRSRDYEDLIKILS